MYLCMYVHIYRMCALHKTSSHSQISFSLILSRTALQCNMIFVYKQKSAAKAVCQREQKEREKTAKQERGNNFRCERRRHTL